MAAKAYSIAANNDSDEISEVEGLSAGEFKTNNVGKLPHCFTLRNLDIAETVATATRRAGGCL